MKYISKIAFAIILSLTFFACSTEEANTNLENQSELINDFKKHSLLFKVENSSSLENKDIIGLLDSSNNYEETIFNTIVNNKVIEKNNSPNKNINYTPTEFDKIFVSNVLENLREDNISVFFEKVSHYKYFVDNEVTDIAHQQYLNKTLEEFKWIKYSIHYVLNNDSGNNVAHRGSSDCFDGCMENKISNALDDTNWIDWAIFLATIAETTAGWAASCIGTAILLN